MTRPDTIYVMFVAPLRVVIAILLNVCLTGTAVAAMPLASDVRLGVHAGKTRLVIELSDTIDFSVFALADPYRIVVDLPEIAWQAPDGAYRRKGGLIDGLRFGLFKPGQSRLVLDLKAPAEVSAAFVLPPRDGHPFRFVIDLKPQTRAAFLNSMSRTARPAPDTDQDAPPQPPVSARRPPDAPFVVVLDPGHGGVDPGAISASGLYEKHLTLQFAEEIRRVLQDRQDYRVIMTRDHDIFLRLRQRVELARREGGDLFISLHADSIEDRRVRGGGIYTLSETASDAEAAALAAKENRADIIAGVDLVSRDDEVASILIELTQRETMNYSARFANALIPQLRRHISLRRRPHRFAGFRVLKAPDVPSVLVELGYLSNLKDEAQLRSARHRRAIAEAIVSAIDYYREELGR